jgi:hypothetical protein
MRSFKMLQTSSTRILVKTKKLPHRSIFVPRVDIIHPLLNLPVLSAQLITAPTGKPNDILNFAPAEPPRPKI